MEETLNAILVELKKLNAWIDIQKEALILDAHICKKTGGTRNTSDKHENVSVLPSFNLNKDEFYECPAIDLAQGNQTKGFISVQN